MSKYPQLQLKDGDIKECCIGEPDLKGVADIGDLDELTLVGFIRRCAKNAEAIALEVIRDGQKCEWCFVVDTTELDGPGAYEIEFVVSWLDEGDERVCHWPTSGFVAAEVQASTST